MTRPKTQGKSDAATVQLGNFLGKVKFAQGMGGSNENSAVVVAWSLIARRHLAVDRSSKLIHVGVFIVLWELFSLGHVNANDYGMVT